MFTVVFTVVPAVAALGYAVHTMVTMRPWLLFTQPERTIPTDSGIWTEVFGSWSDRPPWDEEEGDVTAEDDVLRDTLPGMLD